MPGIAVTPKVRDALRRIQNRVVLDALWVACEHPELVQGTSTNENWHSWLRSRIPILGGVRGYAMLVIFLTWNMMRFNEAVQAKQDAAALRRPRSEQPAEASAKPDRAALREKGLRRRFAHAFSRGTMQPSTRRAYDPQMSESYDLDTMKTLGFVEAKPQAAQGAAWSEEEVSAMLQCLADLHTGEDAIHTQDPFYFLAHHALLRQKSPAQVKRMLQYLDEKYRS